MNESDSSGLRIGDAEREQALRALGEHMSAGRLDIDEYGDRSARVSSARTRNDLVALFTDLPAPRPSFRTATPAVPDPAVPAPKSGWRMFPGEITGPIIGATWVSAVFIGPAVGASWLFGVAIAVSIILGSLTRKGGCGGRHPWRQHRHERRRMIRDEMRELRRGYR